MRGHCSSLRLPRGLWLLQLFAWPAIAVGLAGHAGVRLNTTSSVPVGFYQVRSNPKEYLAELCPPGPLGPLSLERGYRRFNHLSVCPDGGEALLKAIVARPGDVVETSSTGIRVNGRWIPNTAPAVRDSKGRPIPHWPFGRYPVEADTVWVASWFNAKSFDSRYFGPVPLVNVQEHLRPLWTSPAWK